MIGLAYRNKRTEDWKIALKILGAIFGILVFLVGILGMSAVASSNGGGVEGMIDNTIDFTIYLAIAVLGLFLTIAAIAPDSLKMLFKAETRV